MAPWKPSRLSVFSLLGFFLAAACQDVEIKLPPPLYTGDFGDCSAGRRSIAITNFDVAYDSGNGTLVFHLNGASDVNEDSVILRLSIDAYGTNRFDMTIHPCEYNITSLCPLRQDVPITARAVLPAYAQPVRELSKFPFNIPDFEGTAKLQIFSSRPGESPILCSQAAMTNGRTLSHPEIIAPVLGFLTIVAILASFLTAAYGVSIPHMRMHHAHCLSVLVVFETFQSIFFSGALSINWPPILVAWWSNFAWSAGLIYISGLVQPINKFVGVTTGSAGQLIARSASHIFRRSPAEDSSTSVSLRGMYNSTFLEAYAWSGSPVAPGLPLPGTWSGFPSTLSALNIPVADVFILGLIWFGIALGLVVLAIVSLKVLLEGLVGRKKIKQDRLLYFRSHWTGYLGHAVLRTFIIGFFLIMTLAMLQFTIRKEVGPVAVATVVFILVLIALMALVASGCRARTRNGRSEIALDRIVFYRRTILKRLPPLGVARESTLKERAVEVQRVFSVPSLKIRHINNDPNRPTVHQDEDFIKKFGWLTARYRRSRWWFLAYHVAYVFCRAAFLGGAWQSPRVQVYGVLVADILNFATAAILRPFEGTRNTVMGVWLLGICKIVTGGISVALLPGSTTTRSNAAVLGIVVVVIQGLTVAALLVLIVLGAVSSWISMMRNRQEIDPDWLEPARVRYFTSMEKKARDVRFEDDTEPEPNPHFSVISIQRRPKIEDEDEDEDLYVMPELEQSLDDSPTEDQQPGGGRGRHSHASSVGPRLSTGSLPRAARPYRASWSSRDFREASESPSRPDSVVTARLSGVTCIVITDCDASTTSSTALVKRQSSMWSLNTPSVSRASSPSTGRLSREFLPDGRRPPTALPEAPEQE